MIPVIIRSVSAAAGSTRPGQTDFPFWKCVSSSGQSVCGGAFFLYCIIHFPAVHTMVCDAQNRFYLQQGDRLG